MNSFDLLKPQIYIYLGYKNFACDCDALIHECLSELYDSANFRAIHKIYSQFPEFLKAEPYASFLDGCQSVIISVTTLGHEVDRTIKALSRTDMNKAVVFDCCASALLESMSDDYENSLAKEHTYRFCPGYGGSSVTDLKHIFRLMQPEKIGVTLGESCYMLPAKSMAGIIGVGKKTVKTCGDCVNKDNCNYMKEGVKCYRIKIK